MVCDGNKDCDDNSDETDCDSCRAPEWFDCRDSFKTCVHHSFVCDGEQNCSNNEDEENCPEKPKTTEDSVCSKFEFACQDKSCIPLDMVCDGRKNCRDNSDETIGCEHAELTCEGFFCLNKKCLASHTWVCDGYDDCGDNSDEHGCAWNCKLEEGKFLCKDNDSCINLSEVCDDTPHCSDKSDENGLCHNKKTTCDNIICPKNTSCIHLPTGPTCICPKGFTYNQNTNKCDDIDECQHYGICSQNCTNTNGSYECSCLENFQLKNDNRTCTANRGEPLLLFSTQDSIIAMYLHSKHVYKVAEKLNQAIGVAYDGQHIYWTQIKMGHESIVRAREDGSKQETLVTNGLQAPEDLALDWLTGNIYFTDNDVNHIAVCTNHGDYCKTLVTIDVDKPRGIALFPQMGEMYWSDWGTNPMIAKSQMDGSNVKPFVTENIKWPNCIAIDYPSKRLYWVDAKSSTIENINLDGTDRRSIINDMNMHPYGISVFQDNLYWSDWATQTINVCNKFNGKNHEVIFKDSHRPMYAVHAYHSSIQPRANHPCKYNSCSHICLLAGKTAKCACPNDMELNSDGRSCTKTKKTKKLYIGSGHSIFEIEHKEFGRCKITAEYPLSVFVSNLEYNNINGTLFIADNKHAKIWEFDPILNTIEELVSKNINYIKALAFDHLSHNLYWIDSISRTVKVYSIQTGKEALIHFYHGSDIPVGLAVKPELGHIYVALKSSNGSHIDTLSVNGKIYRTFTGDLGESDIQLYLHTTPNENFLFWLDQEKSKIEFSDLKDLSRKLFRDKLLNPYSLTVIGTEVFWSQKDSSTIFWTHINGLVDTKRLETEQPLAHLRSKDPNEMFIISNKPPVLSSLDKHKCLIKNGGCSDVCIASGTFTSLCVCSPGHIFKDNLNKTCIEAIDCEFRCKSGECITSSRRCNGKNDCVDASDETNCDKPLKKICNFDEFRCHDGTECINNSRKCDKIKDCSDSSDEQNCEKFDIKTKCRFNQFRCNNSVCIDVTSVCDNFDDCGDNSDEKNCELRNEGNSERGCSKEYFQCAAGTCIPKNWECDSHLDCIDGSDEHEKCDHTCSKGSVQCRSGQCIDSKLLCDGNNDCEDNSDEINCSEKETEKFICDDAEDSFGNRKNFQCTSNLNICLDISAKCNGTAECPRGEDELNCSMCSIYEFKCASFKQCIRNEWLCDGTKDCDDGSDEINCTHLQNKTSISAQFHHHLDKTVCHGGMFSCGDGNCIEQKKICDGTKDCTNGNDESEVCKTACQNNGKCQHDCLPTPYGAVCSCKHGYRLNHDKLTCSDIDECQEGNPCAQICENLDGDYRCSCYPEFMLRPDKISCKSIEGGAYLLYSSFDQARIISENPVTVKLAWSTNDSKIEGIDVDINNKKAYFTLKDSNSIYEYNLNETVNRIERVLSDPGRKKKISIDWITGNVYVVANTGVDTIKVCNFNNKKCARIIKLRARDSIKDIAVDSINRYLFYSVTYFSIFGNPKTTLYKTSLDGQKSFVLLSDTLYITSIELDVYKKIIYYIDFHSKTLQSINYEKKNYNEYKPKIIIKKENAIKFPTGLSIYENTAFIVNTGSSEAVKCNLYGEMKCHAFNINVYNAEDIIVVGVSRQPKSKNFCSLNKCSVLCIHAELGAKCICYNGERSAIGEQCPSPLQSTEFSNFDDIYNEQHSKLINMNNDNPITSTTTTTSSISKTFITLLSILSIIISCILGYIYYRKKYDNNNFSVNMYFQNPLNKNLNNQNNNNNQNINKNSNSNNEDENLEQNEQRHVHFNSSSPSVSTRFYKNNNKTTTTATTSTTTNTNNFTSKLPFYGPIQKFFNSEKYNEISMESSDETKRQIVSNIQTVKGTKYFTYKIGKQDLMESTHNEYTSGDLGDFVDDDPRSRLVP